MKITVDVPDKVSLRDIHVVNTEPYPKGLKADLKKHWKKLLARYKPLTFPTCCEYCHHIGEAPWHCHNSRSPQYGLNVQSMDVCRWWRPNIGLMMYLSWRRFG